MNLNSKIGDSNSNRIPSQNTGNFFGKLFQIRDQIHLTHLSIRGQGAYAAHVALGAYYDELLDLIDSLVESYQGKYGILDIVIPTSTKVNPIVVLKSLVSLTDGGVVYQGFKETWIQNQLDEISALTYQTLYKLENLS